MVVAVALPVGAAYWLGNKTIALSAYQGMTFMIIAVTRLPVSRQAIVGVCAGAATGVGILVADSMPLLLTAVAAACLAQRIFNRWSIATAALLPAIPAAYAFTRSHDLLSVTTATWAGAALVIALATVLKIRPRAAPAEPEVAAAHAAALAVGCLALIVINTAAGFPHGIWAVTTLCLVFLPSSGENRAQVTTGVLATVTGAVAATALAVALPDIVCLALAAGCAIVTVAYALVPGRDARFMYTAFLTCTVMLLYGAGKVGEVLSLAEERILSTAIASVIAIVLTALVIFSTPIFARLHEKAQVRRHDDAAGTGRQGLPSDGQHETAWRIKRLVR